MESAIPSHLRCPRTQAARMAENYTPPVPAFTGRYNADVSAVVMAYFGAQYQNDADKAQAQAGMNQLKRAVRQGDAAAQFDDLAYCVDDAGYDTLVMVAYWADRPTYERWAAQEAAVSFWNDPARLQGNVGWFREVAMPSADRFETLISSPDGQEAVARLAQGVSGEIQEHAYWGGMRDRLPVSQTDALTGGDLPAVAQAAPGQRVRIQGVQNMALIRSGQNWGLTSGAERDKYLGEVEPVLGEGMDFLASQGAEVGCLCNRYLRVLDDNFAPVEKSYGVSWWRSLEHMEKWAEVHPTHLKIFGTFMGMIQALGAPPTLRLYHEVSVLQSHDQDFEYFNCHSRTGLLRLAS